MKKLALLVLAGTAIIPGCTERQPEQSKLPGTIKEYMPAQAENSPDVRLEKKVTRELQITDVQHSAVSFGMYETESNTFSISHGLTFVLASDPESKVVLIYPHPKGIHRGIADITYHPVRGGEISSKELVRMFVNADFMHVRLRQVDSEALTEASFDNFAIEADGIIIKDGIRYK